MSIMSIRERSDSRSAARLLAWSARELVRGGEGAPLDRVGAVTNVYRMLENYRAGAPFEDDAPSQSFPAAGVESVPAMPLKEERHGVGTRAAFDLSMKAAFASLDEGIAEIEQVLLSVAFPGRHEATREASADVAKFFDVLFENLRREPE